MAARGAVAVLPQLSFPWTADPVGDQRDRDQITRLGPAVYFQWAGRDQFVPPETRAAFATANPAAKVSLYDGSSHFLDQPAVDDRAAWLGAGLGL